MSSSVSQTVQCSQLNIIWTKKTQITIWSETS